MYPPPTPMDTDSPSAKGKKRTAETFSSTPHTPQDPLNNNDAPRILRRHRHRRRNVAATIWGLDIPPTPPTTTAPCAPSPSPQPFNIYKALLRHPNLFFQFALRLPYPTIIHLYAIDKEFHYRLNKYSVSLIHDYARYHAPLASYIFSWVLYPHLCISDPMLRPMDGRAWLARDVPSFRWIGMVLWRARVVRCILSLLTAEGHRVPSLAASALMKFWVLMEMKTTGLRAAFLRDTAVWTDAEILCFQLFLVKLDMRFADPVLGNGVCALSHLLLTQKSLSTLWKVLSGKLVLDYDTTTDLVVRTYRTEELDADTHPWLDDEIDNGVPEEEWGILCREGWHMDGARMESAVDMLGTEGIRRGLNVQGCYLDFVMYGFVDGRTGENLATARFGRDMGAGASGKRNEWPGKQMREKMVEKLDGEFLCRRERHQDEMDMSD
ncbi:Nn.00g080020.m01.CDS01 [Neocucurbitaria sp. VM-36]